MSINYVIYRSAYNMYIIHVDHIVCMKLIGFNDNMGTIQITTDDGKTYSVKRAQLCVCEDLMKCYINWVHTICEEPSTAHEFDIDKEILYLQR